MPLYMDRHDAPGISPEELAELHTRDIAVQERHGVRYHTYWFDPANGSVFCLAEGPTQQAIEDVHQEAHGQLASTILELDPNVPLNTIMGAQPEYPAGTPYTAPAMRAIVFTDLVGSVEQTSRLGDEAHVALLRVHNTIVRAALDSHDGREVKHTGDGIMAAFNSVASAVAFAIAAQRAFRDHNDGGAIPLDVKIGISAGEPVTDDTDDLFGAAVQLAARLCDSASAGEIAVSLAVRELCVGKQFLFETRGPVRLKGLPEPITAYGVSWLDANQHIGLLRGLHDVNLGRVSSAALMASGLAGSVMPERVAAALDLPAVTKRGIAETRAGLGGTYAALGGWALVSRDPTAQAAVGLVWLGAAGARVVSLLVDQPETDGAFWAYLAAEIGLGAVALIGARRARRKIV